jgi:hypothetical protein
MISHGLASLDPVPVSRDRAPRSGLPVDAADLHWPSQGYRSSEDNVSQDEQEVGEDGTEVTIPQACKAGSPRRWQPSDREG